MASCENAALKPSPVDPADGYGKTGTPTQLEAAEIVIPRSGSQARLKRQALEKEDASRLAHPINGHVINGLSKLHAKQPRETKMELTGN